MYTLIIPYIRQIGKSSFLFLNWRGRKKYQITNNPSNVVGFFTTVINKKAYLALSALVFVPIIHSFLVLKSTLQCYTACFFCFVTFTLLMSSENAPLFPLKFFHFRFCNAWAKRQTAKENFFPAVFKCKERTTKPRLKSERQSKFSFSFSEEKSSFSTKVCVCLYKPKIITRVSFTMCNFRAFFFFFLHLNFFKCIHRRLL